QPRRDEKPDGALPREVAARPGRGEDRGAGPLRPGGLVQPRRQQRRPPHRLGDRVAGHLPGLATGPRPRPAGSGQLRRQGRNRPPRPTRTRQLTGGRSMSLHVFATFVTPFGTAANNRAETEGNITTLQKLIWMGETHSTVSAEAICFALRRLLAAADALGTNRKWDEDDRNNTWQDWTFKGWVSTNGETFIDDDLLG